MRRNATRIFLVTFSTITVVGAIIAGLVFLASRDAKAAKPKTLPEGDDCPGGGDCDPDADDEPVDPYNPDGEPCPEGWHEHGLGAARECTPEPPAPKPKPAPIPMPPAPKPKPAPKPADPDEPPPLVPDVPSDEMPFVPGAKLCKRTQQPYNAYLWHSPAAVVWELRALGFEAYGVTITTDQWRAEIERFQAIARSLALMGYGGAPASAVDGIVGGCTLLSLTDAHDLRLAGDWPFHLVTNKELDL